MFKRTPCYDCTRPERLPNGLCEKGCQVKADYLAEKEEYTKKKTVEYGLNLYVGKITARCKKYANNNRRYGGQK